MRAQPQGPPAPLEHPALEHDLRATAGAHEQEEPNPGRRRADADGCEDREDQAACGHALPRRLAHDGADGGPGDDQADRGADQAGDGGLGRGEADELALGRATEAEQAVLAALGLRQGRLRGQAESGGGERPRDPEEQEEDLRVGRVGRRLQERLGRVVGDDHRPRSGASLEQVLERVRPGHRPPGIGRIGGVVDRHVRLDADGRQLRQARVQHRRRRPELRLQRREQRPLENVVGDHDRARDERNVALNLPGRDGEPGGKGVAEVDRADGQRHRLQAAPGQVDRDRARPGEFRRVVPERLVHQCAVSERAADDVHPRVVLQVDGIDREKTGCGPIRRPRRADDHVRGGEPVGVCHTRHARQLPGHGAHVDVERGGEGALLDLHGLERDPGHRVDRVIHEEERRGEHCDWEGDAESAQTGPPGGATQGLREQPERHPARPMRSAS